MIRKLILILMLSTSVVAVARQPQQEIETIQAFNKFTLHTPAIEVMYIDGEAVIVDFNRLMYCLLNVESDFGKANLDNAPAIGVAQIEEDTFNGMIKDRRFRDEVEIIEDRYDVKLKDYNKNEYSNIVAAYAVLKYKIFCAPHWMNKLKISYRSDVEWMIYKIYYNSIDGATEYKKWSE